MAYVITDDCVACGLCARKCPMDAITEGDDIYQINARLCVDCAACAEECPVEAIHKVGAAAEAKPEKKKKKGLFGLFSK
ncbi:MAG: 4Fe-4S dicluster domain-containing protein [Clostridiales bacterium]|nr:4Fe-4S dicluster domain-containing protein [Clostridiales bacterium]